MTAFRREVLGRREDVLDTLDEAVAFLAGLDLPPRTRHSAELVLEELLSNVLKYAYPRGEPGPVVVGVELLPRGILVETEDRGRPFDPTSAPPAPPMTLDAPAGGRGLHLVRSVARSMTYRRVGGRNAVSVELDLP